MCAQEECDSFCCLGTPVNVLDVRPPTKVGFVEALKVSRLVIEFLKHCEHSFPMLSKNSKLIAGLCDPDGISLEEFRKTQLKMHNELRKKHGAEPLVLDDELNRTSLEWAQKMATSGQLRHNPSTKYGENVFYSSGNVNTATESWYNEISRINPNTPIEQEFKQKQIGHFTAVVWKSTNKMGISFAKDTRGGYFVVANYEPAGNLISKIKENVQL